MVGLVSQAAIVVALAQRTVQNPVIVLTRSAHAKELQSKFGAGFVKRLNEIGDIPMVDLINTVLPMEIKRLFDIFNRFYICISIPIFLIIFID